MSLVVRIRADISALTQGFQQAIQAADAFEKKLSGMSGSGAFGNLVQDMQHVSKGLGGAGLKIHAFAKDAAIATRGLTQATANLTAKLGPLATALDKATNSMSRFSQTARARLPQATAAIQNFSSEAQAAINPVTGLFNQMGAGARQAANATNALNRVSQAAQGMGAILTENTSLWTRFTVALGGALVGSMVSQVFWRLGDALLRLPSLMVELAGSIEQTKIALNTMVGEGDKANKFFRDLQQFAVETPFEFEGLMKSAKMLMAMGINSKAILPILRAVGDSLAAVGGTSYQIENVSRALAQMAAKGKLNAEELNQLAENGIPAVDMLAKKIGVSTGKIMEMAEKSQLAAAKYLPMLINEMESRFTGMMEKQNKTITGSLAMLSDAFKLTFGEIGKRVIDATHMTDAVRALAAAFMNLGTAVRDQGLPGLFLAAFGQHSRNAMIGVATAIGAITYSAARMGIAFLATVPALAQMRDALKAMTIATIKQTLLFAAIGAVAFAIGVNLKYLGERFSYFGKQAEIVIQNVAEKLGLITERITELGNITLEDVVTGNWRNIQRNGIANFWSNWNESTERNSARLATLWQTPFTQSFINPLDEAGKAIASFSSLFEEKTNKMKLGTEKLTTSLLGIAAGADAVKSKDISGQLERQANKAMATANAYDALKTNLEGIIAKEIELGYAYDENRAIADALSPVISALTAQYGRKDARVQELIKTQQQYRRLSIEVSQVEQRRFKSMSDLITIGVNLGNALKLISEEAENNGSAYNQAEAQAKAYKNAIKSLGAVKINDPLQLSQWAKKIDPKVFASLGKDLPQAIANAIKSGDVTAIVNALSDMMAKATDSAQEFDVSKIMNDAAKSFDLARRQASALGKSFDVAAEQTRNITEQIEKLTALGTEPANREIEKLKKRLEALRSPIGQVITALGETAGAMQALAGAFTASFELLDTFGVKINDNTKAALDFASKFVAALAGVAVAFGTLLTALNTFSAAFAANPILMGILAIAGAVALIIGLTAAWMNADAERAKKAEEFQKSYRESLVATNTRLTETMESAARAYEERGEIATILSDEEMAGVMALINRYHVLDQKLLESAAATADVIAGIREEIKSVEDQLNTALPAAVVTNMRKSTSGFYIAVANWRRASLTVAQEAAAKIGNSLKGGIIDSLKSAGKAFLEGAADWQWKLRQGIRDAVISGIVDAMVKRSIIDVIMPDIERLATGLQKGMIDSGTVNAIFTKADTLGRNLERALGPIRDVITGFKVEAPAFNEAFSGVIGGANQLMNTALAAGDIAGIGRAAAQFQAGQTGAYGSQYNDITINFQGRGTGITEQEARAMGQKIVDQLRRSGNG